MPDPSAARRTGEPTRTAGRPTTVTGTRRSVAAAGAAALLLLAAGCGDDTSAGTAAAPTTTGAATSSADPTGATPTQPPATATDGPITLTGTVEPGVEPGCLLLDGYLLVGGPAGLRAGSDWTVTGQVDSGLVTTCQQGVPVLVETAQPA